MYETFGEDPFVAAQMGVQLVRGIQAFEPATAATAAITAVAGGTATHEGGIHADTDMHMDMDMNMDMNTSMGAAAPTLRQTPHRAAACLKHFIGYSAPSSGHDRTPVALPDRSLLQYYAPPFAAAIAAGALALMAAP